MNHLEIEFKTMLTKDEFNRLKAQFSHVAPVTQTNYYFDTENFDMKAHRMSLHIRTISNAAELTLKSQKTSATGSTISLCLLMRLKR